MVVGAVFLMIMFIFIPVAFYKNLGLENSQFPFHEVRIKHDFKLLITVIIKLLIIIQYKQYISFVYIDHNSIL